MPDTIERRDETIMETQALIDIKHYEDSRIWEVILSDRGNKIKIRAYSLADAEEIRKRLRLAYKPSVDRVTYL